MKKIMGFLACLILAGIPSAFPQNPQTEDELNLKARRFLTAMALLAGVFFTGCNAQKIQTMTLLC